MAHVLQRSGQTKVAIMLTDLKQLLKKYHFQKYRLLWYKFDILPSKLFSLLGGELTFFVDIEDVRKTMGRGKDVLFGYETASTFMNPLCVTVFRIFS